MKKVLAIVGFALVGSSFALDEYLPVEAKKLEVDLGYSFMKATGGYDADAKKQDLPDDFSASGNMIPLQLKYGIIPGLDAELLWAFQMNSSEAPAVLGGDQSTSGFGQPEIALKYAMMDIGVGAFVNLIAPFATGDLADPTPGMGLAFGLVYTKLLTPQFNLTGLTQYRLNMEDGDKVKDGNVFSIYAKPEFRFNQFGGAYLGVRYDMISESETDGTGGEDDGYLVTLLPGWNATWLPNVSTEVNVPLTIMGKNQGAFWGINVAVYYTLPM